MKLRKTLLATAVLTLAAVSPILAEKSQFQQQLDKWIAEVYSLQLAPGVAVAVVVEDRVVYLDGHGYADVSRGRPATAETAFYIASATKPFTGTAAAMLHHSGAWDIDQSLHRYLPPVRLQSPLDADAITVRDLLTHTHGIDNDGPVTFRAAYSGTASTDRMIELLSLHPAAKEGRSFKYGNIGYNAASLALEKAVEKNWKDVLAGEVFSPLGMNATTGYASKTAADRLAQPYGVEAVGFQPLHYAKSDENMHAAGGLLTTAADLAIWLEANLNAGKVDGKQVLAAEAVAEAQRRQVEQQAESGPFQRDGYGLGWNTGSYDGHRLLHHFGGFSGFHAHTSFMPDEKIGVAVLANSLLGMTFAELVSTYAYDVLLKKEGVETRAAMRLEEARKLVARIRSGIAADRARRAARPQELPRPLKAYAGVYENPAFGRVEFRLVEGRLEATMGPLWSRVEVYDAEKEALRVELTGGGTVVVFRFDDDDRAAAFSHGPVVFERVE